MPHHWTPPTESILNGADAALEAMSDRTLFRIRQTADDLASLARQMGRTSLAIRAARTVEHVDAYLEDRRYAQHVVRMEQLRLPVEA